MTAKHSIVVACLLAFSSLVLAQSSVDGVWKGEVQGGRGPQPITLTLKAEGGKVTGTLTGGRGGAIMIEEGTLAGSTLMFKTTQQGRGGEMVFEWTGTVMGSEIAFSRVAGGGTPQKFTVKKG